MYEIADLEIVWNGSDNYVYYILINIVKKQH